MGGPLAHSTPSGASRRWGPTLADPPCPGLSLRPTTPQLPRPAGHLQGCEHHHLLLGAVGLLQQQVPPSLLIQLGQPHRVCLQQGWGRLGSVGANGPELPVFLDPVSLSHQPCLCAVTSSARGPTWAADPNASLTAAQTSDTFFPVRLFAQMLTVCLLCTCRGRRGTEQTSQSVSEMIQDCDKSNK